MQLFYLLIIFISLPTLIAGSDSGMVTPDEQPITPPPVAPSVTPTTTSPNAPPITTPTTFTRPLLTTATKTQILADGTVQISPYQQASPRLTEVGTKIKYTTSNKHDTPISNKILTRGIGLNFFKNPINHMGGSELFNGALANSFDAFLQSLKTTPDFLPYFQKIRLFALNDIYNHLLKIYTCFNMQHPTSAQEYITQETTYGTNKKTLVINHLVNIIEAQVHNTLIQMFPTLTQEKASWTGNFLSKHDTTDITTLLEDEAANFYLNATDKSIISSAKQNYTTTLGKYLDFSYAYTSLLDSNDPTTGLNLFISAAQKVSTVVNNFTQQFSSLIDQNQTTISLTIGSSKTAVPLKGSIKASRDAKTAGKYLNPGIFFYNETVFRGLKLIPELAQKIDKKYQKIDWPTQTIKDAQNATPATAGASSIEGVTGDTVNLGYPKAYFKNALGQETVQSSGASGLFINIPMTSSVYEQELLKEPDWLGSKAGILQILKACLGDFSQIIGMGILDPCVEIILKNTKAQSVLTKQLSSTTSCSDLLKKIQDARTKYYQDQQQSSGQSKG